MTRVDFGFAVGPVNDVFCRFTPAATRDGAGPAGDEFFEAAFEVTGQQRFRPGSSSLDGFDDAEA